MVRKLYQRCTICKRKVMAISSQCKCEKYVCPKHKNEHGCSFDYHKKAKEHLRKQNPVIVGNKIIEI